MTRFETSIRISRPIEEVFASVSDPLNFNRWNSAVLAMRKVRGRENEVGSTYAMERRLPSGRVQNELAIVAHPAPTEFGIRTTSGPTPLDYRYRFSAADSETIVHLDAVVELDGAKALLGPLAGRAIDAEWTTTSTSSNASSKRPCVCLPPSPSPPRDCRFPMKGAPRLRRR